MRKAYIVTTALIFAVSILLAALCFSTSYIRIFESVKDLGLSLGFYFCEIFGVQHDIHPTVNEYTNVFDVVMPEEPQEFATNTKSFWAFFFDANNFSAWGNSVAVFLTKFLMVAVLLIPCIVVLVLLVKYIYSRPNNNYGKDTKPLMAFKWLSDHTYRPMRNFVIGYIHFVSHRKIIRNLFIVLWLCNLNLMTIAVEFFAFYFYFAASFEIATIYRQVVKLFTDLQVVFLYVPLIAIIAAILLFNRWRRNIALMRLRHYEARNCGFINELPIVSIACGSMGKKKTTLITDMTLSQEVMFRQKALGIMQNSDMKFPYFPWIRLENELKKCMEHHTVYNLATVKLWINKKRNRFDMHGNADLQLYGYDIYRYGYYYYDELKTYDLFDVLETYSLAYFIYVIESSLIVSNYSVRTDSIKSDLGNLPVWMTDFFTDRGRSRHSHILDFDVLRLGKKVIEDNPKAGSFEFGVVTISEIGKERGNMLELKEVKRNNDEANQKNDLFNSWLKMCRHSATVDNFPFIKVFTDEQRPESWGADARDLCDVVTITDSSESKLAYPLYDIEQGISEWAFGFFMRKYMQFRYLRGDNTLFVHILKTITVWLWKRNVRIINSYGYVTLQIQKERGTMDGKKDKKKYYLMNSKIYRNRFCTDCFSDYFNDLASRTNVGLDDYLEYQTEKATVDELKEQNSYFINSLYGR